MGFTHSACYSMETFAFFICSSILHVFQWKLLKSPCVLQDIIPFGAAALLTILYIHIHTKQGNGYRWPHIASYCPLDNHWGSTLYFHFLHHLPWPLTGEKSHIATYCHILPHIATYCPLDNHWGSTVYFQFLHHLLWPLTGEKS